MSDIDDEFTIIDSDLVQTTGRGRKSKKLKDETRYYLRLYRIWQKRHSGSDLENPYEKYIEGRWVYEIELEKTFRNVVDVCDDDQKESVEDESESLDDDDFMDDDDFTCFECGQTYEMLWLGLTEQGLHLCHDCYEDCSKDPDWRD
jgi:hypothetical protein